VFIQVRGKTLIGDIATIIETGDFGVFFCDFNFPIFVQMAAPGGAMGAAGELSEEQRWRLEHAKMHEKHKGHEQMHMEMFLILIVTLVVAQVALVQWKRRHFKSYQVDAGRGRGCR
jgi:hypothetical protein